MKTFSTIRPQIQGTRFVLMGHSLNSGWLNSDSGLCGACHGLGFRASTETKQRVAGRSYSLNTEDLWLFSQVNVLRHPATDVSGIKIRKALANQCRFRRHSCIYPINLCFYVIITNLWLGWCYLQCLSHIYVLKGSLHSRMMAKSIEFDFHGFPSHLVKLHCSELYPRGLICNTPSLEGVRNPSFFLNCCIVSPLTEPTRSLCEGIHLDSSS